MGFPSLPLPLTPTAFSSWWILMEENKCSQKSLSAGLSPFALCFGSAAGVGGTWREWE